MTTRKEGSDFQRAIRKANSASGCPDPSAHSPQISLSSDYFGPRHDLGMTKVYMTTMVSQKELVGGRFLGLVRGRSLLTSATPQTN